MEPPASSHSAAATTSAAPTPTDARICAVIDDVLAWTAAHSASYAPPPPPPPMGQEQQLERDAAALIGGYNEQAAAAQAAVSTYMHIHADLPDNFLDNMQPADGGGAHAPTLASLTPVSLLDNHHHHHQPVHHPSHHLTAVTSAGSLGLTPLMPVAVSGGAMHPYLGQSYQLMALKLEPTPAELHSVPAGSLLSPLNDSSSASEPLVATHNGGLVKLEGRGGTVQATTTTTVDLASNLISNLLDDRRAVDDDDLVARLSPQQLAREVVVRADSRQSSVLGQHVNNATPRRQAPKRPAQEPVRQLSEMAAELEEDIYIDTKELCRRVAYELKQHSIPQAIFAERVLCRSQGTLSDLLRNPKPWNKLKSGRETFRRMYAWIQQPLPQRLASLELWKAQEAARSTQPNASRPLDAVVLDNNSPAVAAKYEQLDAAELEDLASRSDLDDDRVASNGSRLNKRPRLVFTDIQKRTLQAIFKETQRPSREMQQTIAEHLGLDLSTVANFFMNARRRSKPEHNAADQPAPYQQVQVRCVTPPPSSPPSGGGSSGGGGGGRARPPRAVAPTPAGNTAHIASTVDAVAARAAAARQQQQRQQQQQQTARLIKVVPISAVVATAAAAAAPPADTTRRASVTVVPIGCPEDQLIDEKARREEQLANQRAVDAAMQQVTFTTARTPVMAYTTRRSLPVMSLGAEPAESKLQLLAATSAVAAAAPSESVEVDVVHDCSFESDSSKVEVTG